MYIKWKPNLIILIAFSSGRESKEVITRYKTNIKSNSQFWTDSNGRRFMLRRRNWRSTWKFYGYDIIASNYYPVTSAARIGDENTCLTVLTDRAQGAASLQDGEIEFMVNKYYLASSYYNTATYLIPNNGI